MKPSVMNERVEIILSELDLNGLGLEIGPCNHPIAPKSEGYNVEIIDWASEEVLREEYKDDPDLGNIEKVDYIWSGEGYAELIGDKEKFDWIIASHVVEHVPDLVSFFQSCEDVLKPEGVLSLAIPDKRYCFDQFRAISTLGMVLDAYFSRDSKPTIGAIADYFLNISRKNGTLAWNDEHVSSVCNELHYDFDYAFEKYKEALTGDTYIDVHNWCFTPSSFRLIVSDLNRFGLINLKENSFFPSLGCEFFVSLSKNGQGNDLTRLELLEAALEEQMKPYKKKRKKILPSLF